MEILLHVANVWRVQRQGKFQHILVVGTRCARRVITFETVGTFLFLFVRLNLQTHTNCYSKFLLHSCRASSAERKPERRSARSPVKPSRFKEYQLGLVAHISSKENSYIFYNQQISFINQRDEVQEDKVKIVCKLRGFTEAHQSKGGYVGQIKWKSRLPTAWTA